MKIGNFEMPHFPESSSASAEVLTIRPKENATEQHQNQNQNQNQHEESSRIQIKNRRKRYLDLNSDYFKRDELELADPLLYDRLVRRFMSTEEREKEGRERGYTGVLETDLVRSEAKINALQHPDPNSPMSYRRTPNGSIIGIEAERDRVKDKDDGWRIWTDHQTQRFLRGDDQDFDYETVDESEEYDDREEEERNRLESYLERQDEEYVGEGTPKGETGIQDF